MTGKSQSYRCVPLPADDDTEWRIARELNNEYADSLGLDLSFQNFAHELAHLESEYAPPTGAFFIARDNDGSLGCIGLRRFDADTGEIKRLYVVPAARDRGVGRRLAEAAVDAGRKLGYRRLLLDTLPSMNPARSLYLSLGFKPTEAYRFNAVEGTAFLELVL